MAVRQRSLDKLRERLSSGLAPALPTISGNDIRLTIGHAAVNLAGRGGHAVAINGSVPGPLLRLKEGQVARIGVTNTLDEDTSIHWHGLLVPFQMDGVPGVTFPGIKPGETFVYEFPVAQSGTYWYHSHSGLQEQQGHYAPIIINPVGRDPAAYDREHVIVLSDYSFLHPHRIFEKLKQEAGVFNYQRQTLAGLFVGKDQTFAERREWAKALMDPTDISDVTGAVYTFLVNGRAPKDNWTALFQPGERVRLRFINAAAQTIFNVRIPGRRDALNKLAGFPRAAKQCIVGVDRLRDGDFDAAADVCFALGRDRFRAACQDHAACGVFG